jgi:hypothetical protein
VADDRGRALAERVDQPHDIAGQVKDAVCVDRRGTIGLAVAALVGCHDAEARLGERGNLMAPRVPRFRKPMAQNDQRPLAGLDVVHPDAVGLDEVMAWCAHRASAF